MSCCRRVDNRLPRIQHELHKLLSKRVTAPIGYENARRLGTNQRSERNTTMSNDGQSQQVVVKAGYWETLFHLPPIDIAKQPQGAIVHRVPDGDTQCQSAAHAIKTVDLVQDLNACTSVAMSGSVKRNGARLAHAAENVAGWKKYLPEECVRAMMNAGWHWST